MLRDILFIARKDLHYTLRARETIIWVFFMPIVFFAFIGYITRSAQFGATSSPLAVEAADDAGFLAEQLDRRLEQAGYHVVRVGTHDEAQSFERRVSIPSAFTDSVLAGRPVSIRFVNTSEGLDNRYDAIRTRRAVYTVLADVIAASEAGHAVTEETLAELTAMPRSLTLVVAPAVEPQRIPNGYEQAIPGIMVMFTLLIMLTSGAILLVIERRQGLLRRLAHTPIRRLSVVLGKWAGKWVVGMVQIAFAMLAGTILFKMDWGPDPGAIVLVMLVYGGLMAALGILLGSLARTEGQSIAIGVISANLLGALGGCWWPIEITPAWMQKLQLLLPTGWAMDAMHKLISFGAGPASVLPHIAGMAVGIVVLVAVGTRVFRFE